MKPPRPRTRRSGLHPKAAGAAPSTADELARLADLKARA